MSGLQEILNYISYESQRQVEGIMTEADARIEAVSEEMLRRSDEQCGRILEKAALESRLILERGQASAELRKKQMLLSARQEIISGLLDECLRELLALPDEEYFRLLERLFERHYQGGDAELRLSEKDRKRMPEGFVRDLCRVADNRGRISVSDHTEDIGGGFIMDFGDTEEDLSFHSLIEENDPYLRDILNRILFS